MPKTVTLSWREYLKLFKASDPLLVEDLSNRNEELETQLSTVTDMRDAFRVACAERQAEIDKVQQLTDSLKEAAIDQERHAEQVKSLNDDVTRIARYSEQQAEYIQKLKAELAQIKADGYNLAYLASDAIRRVRPAIGTYSGLEALVKKFLAYRPADTD
jgi:chlorite dismutase